jgi:5'-deoxynucleotidase
MCPENIQEHSLQVAQIAHALGVIRRRLTGSGPDPLLLLGMALYHDVGEVLTGDIATPIKHFNPDIKDAYGRIEEYAKLRIFEFLPEELRDDFQEMFFYEDADIESRIIVKAADKLSAYFKCLEEKRMGNSEFFEAEATIREDLQSMSLPEVDYFLAEFVPSLSLSLDDMKPDV